MSSLLKTDVYCLLSMLAFPCPSDTSRPSDLSGAMPQESLLRDLMNDPDCLQMDWRSEGFRSLFPMSNIESV